MKKILSTIGNVFPFISLIIFVFILWLIFTWAAYDVPDFVPDYKIKIEKVTTINNISVYRYLDENRKYVYITSNGDVSWEIINGKYYSTEHSHNLNK